jgi:RNA polymerase sigma factor (sigma-70 family)
MDDLECFRILASASDPTRNQAGMILYNRYAARFLGKLKHWRLSDATCEDIVQEVFRKLLSAKNLLDIRNPAAYMWMMLTREACNEFRRSKREPPIDWRLPAAGEDPDDDSFRIEDIIDQMQKVDTRAPSPIELQECLDRAFASLEKRSPAKVLALQLAAWDGLGGEEIATVLGKKPGAARQYLSDARSLLEEILEQLCPGLLPATLGR